MATRNAGQLCDNRTKAEYRMWVLKAFHIWLRGLIHVTTSRSGRNCVIDPATIYSLPATLWEFEQFVAGESFDVTFPEAGDYDIQCDPHAGAGMKGVIHVS